MAQTSKMAIPSLSNRQDLEEKLAEWERFCEELSNYAEYEYHEAYETWYEYPDNERNRNWYSFALGQKKQLEGRIRQFKLELNELDSSDSEEQLMDRMNEIMLFLSTMFNPSTMNFRSGLPHPTPAAASNIAAALASDTREDVQAAMRQRREEMAQSRDTRSNENINRIRREQQNLETRRAVEADIAKAKQVGQKRKEAAKQFEEGPVPLPPPTKRLQDMTQEDRARHHELQETVKRQISQMEQKGEKRVHQTLDRVNKTDVFGSSSRGALLPPSKLQSPKPGSNATLPIPATSRAPSERLLEQRKKVANIGVIPVPAAVQAPTIEMQQKMAEREVRVNARAEQIRRQQQENMQNQSIRPMPLTELEKQQIADKKQVFAGKDEAIETTNRALTMVKQTMLEFEIQQKGNLEKPTDEESALATLESIGKIGLADQQVLNKYMNYLLVMATAGKLLKSQAIANRVLEELASLPEKLGIDPVTGKLQKPRAHHSMPAALTMEQQWMQYFNEIYNHVQQSNDNLLNNYQESGDQDNENNCLSKINEFLSLRQEKQQLVQEAIQSGDADELCRVVFEALAPLENNDFVCNDVKSRSDQSLRVRILALPQINALKTSVKNQQQIKQAAAKGAERRRQIEEPGTFNASINRSQMQDSVRGNVALSESTIARREAGIAKAKEDARRRTGEAPTKVIHTGPLPPPTKRIEDMTPSEQVALRQRQQIVDETLREKQRAGEQRRLETQQRLAASAQFGDSSRSVALPPSTYDTSANRSIRPLPIPVIAQGPSSQLLAQRSRTADLAVIPKPPPVKSLTQVELDDIEERNKRQSQRAEQIRLQQQALASNTLQVPQISGADRQRIAERQPKIAMDNIIMEVTNTAVNRVRLTMKEHQVDVQSAYSKPESIDAAQSLLASISSQRITDSRTLSKFLNSLLAVATSAKTLRSEQLARDVINTIDEFQNTFDPSLILPPKFQVPSKMPTTEDWLQQFRNMFDEYQTINQIMLQKTRSPDASNWKQKFDAMAQLRRTEEEAIAAAVQTNDKKIILRAISKAIENLTKVNLITSETGFKQAQDITNKIRLPIKAQIQIEEAAEKGSKKAKEIEQRSAIPAPVKRLKPIAKPLLHVEPQPGPSGLGRKPIVAEPQPGPSGLGRKPTVAEPQAGASGLGRKPSATQPRHTSSRQIVKPQSSSSRTVAEQIPKVVKSQTSSTRQAMATAAKTVRQPTSSSRQVAQVRPVVKPKSSSSRSVAQIPKVVKSQTSSTRQDQVQKVARPSSTKLVQTPTKAKAQPSARRPGQVQPVVRTQSNFTVQRQQPTLPKPKPKPSTSDRGRLRQEIDATKAVIAPRLERLFTKFSRPAVNRRAVSSGTMINASVRSIHTNKFGRDLQLPLANELPSPRSSVSEVVMRRRIEELRAAKAEQGR